MDSTIKEWESWVIKMKELGYSQEQIDEKLGKHLSALNLYFSRLGMQNETKPKDDGELVNRLDSLHLGQNSSQVSKPSLSDKVASVDENLKTLSNTPKKEFKESFFDKYKDQINAAVMLVLALAVVSFIVSVVV